MSREAYSGEDKRTEGFSTIPGAERVELPPPASVTARKVSPRDLLVAKGTLAQIGLARGVKGEELIDILDSVDPHQEPADRERRAVKACYRDTTSLMDKNLQGIVCVGKVILDGWVSS